MVPEGWGLIPIKNICERIIDCVNKTAKTVGHVTPYKMIRTTNVRNGRVDTENVRYVNEETYRQWIRRGAPKAGDIIFTREAPVGEVGLLGDAAGVFLGQRTIMYRAHPDRTTSRFLLYSLLSRYCQNQIENFSNGGTVAHVRVPDCGEIIVRTPPLPEQTKIAKILSTWDKAIETVEKLIENSKAQKKALMQQLLTGKRRLPGFDEEWKFSSFKELFKIVNDKTKQVKKSDYKEVGNFPVVDQGKEMIVAYTSCTKPYSDIPVIVFGDHTRIVKWVDFNFAPGADGTQLFKTTDELNLRFAYFLLSNLTLPNLGYSRHMRELKEKEFKYPCSVREQKAIARILEIAEQDVQTNEGLLEILQAEKKALMQQLLTGKRRVKVESDE